MKTCVVIILFLLACPAYGQLVNDSTGSKISSKAAQEVLDHHNLARKEVGAPALSWSKDLASYAQKWADYLASAGKFEHRQSHTYGENIFKGSSNYTPIDASLSWYEEKQGYSYGKFKGNEKAGHYTQMIWKNTTQIGVGVAIATNGDIYVVANYSPPGNYLGQFPY